MMVTYQVTVVNFNLSQTSSAELRLNTGLSPLANFDFEGSLLPLEFSLNGEAFGGENTLHSAGDIAQFNFHLGLARSEFRIDIQRWKQVLILTAENSQ